MTFFWFIVAYVTAYKLGEMRGEVHEREREERSAKKAEEKIVYLKDRR